MTSEIALGGHKILMTEPASNQTINKSPKISIGGFEGAVAHLMRANPNPRLPGVAGHQYDRQRTASSSGRAGDF